MTRSALVVVSALCLIGAGCAASQSSTSNGGVDADDARTVEISDTPFEVTMGETVRLNNMPVHFDTVTEDSRCPHGTTCVWAGRASIRLLVGDDSLTLSIPGQTPSESSPEAHQAGDLAFGLISLSPYPGTDAATPDAQPVATLSATSAKD